MAIRRIRERAIAAVRNTAARVLFLCCLRQRTQVLDNDRRFIITQAEEGSTTVSANSCPGDLLAVQAAAGSLYILCFALFSTSDSPIWRGRHARESSAWFDALDRIGQLSSLTLVLFLDAYVKSGGQASSVWRQAGINDDDLVFHILATLQPTHCPHLTEWLSKHRLCWCHHAWGAAASGSSGRPSADADTSAAQCSKKSSIHSAHIRRRGPLLSVICLTKSALIRPRASLKRLRRAWLCTFCTERISMSGDNGPKTWQRRRGREEEMPGNLAAADDEGAATPRSPPPPCGHRPERWRGYSSKRTLPRLHC